MQPWWACIYAYFKKTDPKGFLIAITYSDTDTVVNILCILVVFCVAAVAQDVCRVAVLEKFWCQWNNVLQTRHVEKDRGQRADKLAQHGSQRLAFSHWRHCIFAYTVKDRSHILVY